MIIIGYQGIGKSTLASKNLKYVDLESGNFWVDGKRADDWYKPYCNVAEHLSQQGYTVFVSSHGVVRQQLYTKKLNGTKERIVCCVPTLTLENEWVTRLEERYKTTNLEKDFKAYMNAKEVYRENTSEIACSCFDIIFIESMDYDLKELIEQSVNGQEE